MGIINGVQPRIVHVVTTADSLKLMDGQLSYLKKKGFDITIVASPGKKLSEVQESDQIRSVAIPIEREIRLLRDIVSLWRLICFFIKTRPDLVNFSTPKAGLLAGIASWVARVPVRVYTLRGLRLETTKGLKRFVLTTAEKIACLCAHSVICISPSLQTKVESLGLTSSKKIRVIGYGSSNGIDLNRFVMTHDLSLKIGQLRDMYNIHKEDRVIGFVGRLTRDKGVTDLVNAYRKLRQKLLNLKLLLVGYYEKSDRLPTHILESVEKDPDIILTGFVDNTVPYYFIFDVLAFPTYREGFGNVALEAAAAGKPVITTRTTGAIDTIVNRVTGFLVDVGDVEQLADRLHQVLTEPKESAQLGEIGRARVERLFRSEVIWEGLADLYSELLKGRLG